MGKTVQPFRRRIAQWIKTKRRSIFIPYQNLKSLHSELATSFSESDITVIQSTNSPRSTLKEDNDVDDDGDDVKEHDNSLANSSPRTSKDKTPNLNNDNHVEEAKDPDTEDASTKISTQQNEDSQDRKPKVDAPPSSQEHSPSKTQKKDADYSSPPFPSPNTGSNSNTDSSHAVTKSISIKVNYSDTDDTLESGTRTPPRASSGSTTPRSDQPSPPMHLVIDGNNAQRMVPRRGGSEIGAARWTRREPSRMVRNSSVFFVKSVTKSLLLENENDQAKITKVQALCRRWICARRIKTIVEELIKTPEAGLCQSQKTMRSRLRVILEILSTEATYCRNLEIVIDNFMSPMLSASNSGKWEVPSGDVLCMFAGIESISSFNGELLKNIRKPFIGGSIGSKFLKMLPFLKMYIGYVNNYSNALATLARCQKLPSFMSYLKELESDPKANELKLHDYLINPIQRVPRYVMLFQSLIQCTDPGHVDYQNLKKLYEQLQGVATMINERKRQSEDMQRMIDLQHELSDCPVIVKPSRKYIREGKVKKSMSKHVEGDERQVYLFNDLLLCVQQSSTKSSKPSLDFFLPLTDVQIFSVSDSDFGYCLQLKFGTEKYYFAPCNPKDDWNSEIKKLIDGCKGMAPDEELLSYITQNRTTSRTLKKITPRHRFTKSPSLPRIKSISLISPQKGSSPRATQNLHKITQKIVREPSRDLKRGYLKFTEIPVGSKSKKLEYKKRWIAIQSNMMIFVYEEEESPQPLFSASIEEGNPVEDPQEEYQFRLELPDVILSFKATTRIEMKLWMQSFKESKFTRISVGNSHNSEESDDSGSASPKN
eukprot:TRINITY_DN17371_c0_g1_i1.p1 TRINITY_DN17371_c0_g1~~TRINITY_DN17371_c0_g1_i1.p1  ORF type:complete len:917 (-),score=188.33 TRINITY_DN17371_c0_g1_i1:236-2710(-)